ncbi:hypothetical protein HNQ79_003344 [Streptomyces candidus]|uniref:Uncharacterized protein n=1 Tax=Streptomyces candidus TaxID=67283 RepID=A0A7X0HFU7_9ACTN|nr:hypothetical protein [Streptomyces candidus]
MPRWNHRGRPSGTRRAAAPCGMSRGFCAPEPAIPPGTGRRLPVRNRSDHLRTAVQAARTGRGAPRATERAPGSSEGPSEPRGDTGGTGPWGLRCRRDTGGVRAASTAMPPWRTRSRALTALTGCRIVGGDGPHPAGTFRAGRTHRRGRACWSGRGAAWERTTEETQRRSRPVPRGGGNSRRTPQDRRRLPTPRRRPQLLRLPWSRRSISGRRPPHLPRRRHRDTAGTPRRGRVRRRTGRTGLRRLPDGHPPPGRRPRRILAGRSPPDC